jgi:RNA methyltransferase, RsmD family
MRVISGKYRGRKLSAPKDMVVRPTTDRVKESLFDIIQFKIRGAYVLDLFCGSGGLGIECVSRGAAFVTFSDVDKNSVALTERNLSGMEYKGEVIRQDYSRALSLSKYRYDFVFLDPPYGTGLAEKAMEQIVNEGVLNDCGTVIYERSINWKYDIPEGLELYDTRTYGETSLDFLRLKV